MKKSKSLVLAGFSMLTVFLFSISIARAEGPLSKEEKLKIRDEAVQKLNNTEWSIEIRSMDNPKKKPENDTVVFRKGKIDSKMFAKDGYTGSNLTVNVEDDGHVMWETMQSSSGKPPIFWRGEMHDSGINGVISKQLDNGASESYSFNAVQTGTLEPEPEKMEAAPAALVSKTEETAAASAEAVMEVAQEAAPQAVQAATTETTEAVQAKVEEVKQPEVTTSKKKSKKK